MLYDPKTKPGVSNLLGILGACTGEDPERLADRYEQYGPLKNDTADAVVEMLDPIRTRLEELRADPAETARLLTLGATKASETAVPVMERVLASVGLLPRG